MRTTMSRFLLRATGLTLLVGGAAIIGFARPTAWGMGAIPCLLWAMLWAVALGAVGFRSLRTALQCQPKEMMRVITTGLILRVVVLGASQVVVYLAVNPQWGARALLATTLFYLLVLAIEVFSIVTDMPSSGDAAAANGTSPSGTEVDASR